MECEEGEKGFRGSEIQDSGPYLHLQEGKGRVGDIAQGWNYVFKFLTLCREKQMHLSPTVLGAPPQAVF